MTLTASTCDQILRDKAMTNAFSRKPATADYSIRELDTDPPIEDTITDQDGEEVSLSDAVSVELLIRRQADGAEIYNESVNSFQDDGSVTTRFTSGFATTGTGMHHYYYRIEREDGSIETYPGGGTGRIFVPERFDEETLPYVLVETEEVDEPIAIAGVVSTEDDLTGEPEGWYYIEDEDNVAYWIP